MRRRTTLHKAKKTPQWNFLESLRTCACMCMNMRIHVHVDFFCFSFGSFVCFVFCLLDCPSQSKFRDSGGQ
jgi:hypothetical protein